MSYGIRVRRPGDGRVVFDSSEASGGVLVDSMHLPAGGISKSYPEFAGRSVFVMLNSGNAGLGESISYSSGYPSVYIPPPGQFLTGLTVLVFAT